MEDAFLFLIIALIMTKMVTVLNASMVTLYVVMYVKHLILFVNQCTPMVHVLLAILAMPYTNLLVLH